MHSAPDWLDPADERAEARAAFLAWLRVLHTHAFRPLEAARALRAGAGPAALRAAPGQAEPSPQALEADRRALLAARARLVPLPGRAYPPALLRLSDPPAVLAVRGEHEALAGPCVAVVGARAATVYGLEVARRLAGALARAGVVVVSGLARGIDAAAHEAALEAGGRTVAFLACGPDRVYPAAHRRLAARIRERGALVSELPPGAPPRKIHFPLRNRLISGLSRAVVVVEARTRSGSLVTARHALDQGIEVLAVPGPVTAATSEGTNALLRDGAAPALSARDVLCAAGLEAECAAALEAECGPDPGPAAPHAALAAPASAILAALRHHPATRDELGRRLALAPGALAVALLELELAGRVAEDRDGRLRALGAGA